MSSKPAIVHRPGYSRLWTEDGNDRRAPNCSEELHIQHATDFETAAAVPVATIIATPLSQTPTKVPISSSGDLSDASHHCKTSESIKRKTLNSPIAIVIILLAAFSTAFSAIFLVVGLHGPSYGKYIGKHGGLSPSKAAFLTTLDAKLVELSFATISVAFVGQVLARRAVEQQKKTGAGITLAEMNMRTWIMQPGTLLTQWQSTRYASLSMLGFVSVIAATMTLLYTSAATALVQPQPVMLWTPKQLQTLVRTQSINPDYLADGCKTPIRPIYDKEFNDSKPDLSKGTCLQVNLGSGALYDLGKFLGTWTDIVARSRSGIVSPENRPAGTTLLYDNTTIQPAWIEIAPVTQSAFSDYRINNATMALPHPGIIQAAQGPVNNLPPHSGPDVQLEIRASLRSPVLNVICVTMNTTQARPFVYSMWDGRNRTSCNETDWSSSGPGGTWPRCSSYPNNLNRYLNGTEFDDIFRWGEKYGVLRYPPIFPILPKDYNTILNDSVGFFGWGSTSIYMLGKGGPTDSRNRSTNVNMEDTNYALCGISAAITPFCSTRYNVTAGGAKLQVVCDDDDPYQYIKSARSAPSGNSTLSKDFVNIAGEWARSTTLNAGLLHGNASVGRLLTQLIVTSEHLASNLPSTAESLAVLGANLLIQSSMDSPATMFWNYTDTQIDGSYQYFNASVRMQQYKSGGTQPYEEAFTIVLIVVFAMSVLILAYFLFHRYWYTDSSEPTHLFTLALQSPASDKIAGSCATGPIGEQYNIRWQVDTDDGHYYVTPQDESISGHGSDMKKRRGWKEDVELLLRK